MTRKVLLLGSGFVARPCAEYIVRDPNNELVVACRTLSSAKALAEGLPNTTAISLDVNSTTELEAKVAAHDLVISLIPYTHHVSVIKAAIKGKTHVVTTSYVSAAMRALDAEVKAAGIVVVNEIGLDPGIDHLYAIKTISEVHEKGGKIKELHSYGSGLPAPEFSDNPLKYKFSWSARGVLLATQNPASYLSGGKRVDIAGKDLMQHAKPCFILPGYSFVAFPNRDSVPFREFYNIPEVETVIRYTVRYEGNPDFIRALVDLGFLDTSEKEWLTADLTWAEVTQRAIGASAVSESSLIDRVKAVCNFPNESESARIIAGLQWIGLFSNEKVVPKGRNLLDTLCARLEVLLKYEPGERDLALIHHKFIVEWADGTQQTLTSTLLRLGDPSGHSGMAVTVGVPCGIATQLVLDGVINTPGVHAPYTKELCDPLRAVVEREGLGMVESVL